MSRFKLDADTSVLLVIDVQEALLSSIHNVDAMLKRQAFLIEVAQLLGVPVIATEQNPARMGATASSLKIPAAHSKMSFSVCGCSEAMAELEATGRDQAVLIGIETHICVNQTAHDLLSRDWRVAVCADATSARSQDRHDVGLARMRDAGAVMAHTESVAYEWLTSADHPSFRDALRIVKAYA